MTGKTTGKDIHIFPKITEGDNPKYEGPCDHPRLVQHVGIRPVSWLANCETSPIIHQNLLALMKYLSSYACKGAATTSEMIGIFRNLLNKATSGSTLRSMAQKLILKTVGIVDTPGAAADFINSGNHLYKCSRKFRRVGLSGCRVLEKGVKAGASVTKKSTLDGFLSDTRRKQLGNDITLYDWAKICNCAARNSCNTDHVPLFTGFLNVYSWPVQEEFARAQLMMFSPGHWRSPEDLLTVQGDTYENFTSAFAVFIDTPQCPEALKKMLIWAKDKYDSKKPKRNQQFSVDINLPDVAENEGEDFSSQSSQRWSQESTNATLGYELMRDLAEQEKNRIFEGPLLDQNLYDGGPNFDWHAYALNTLSQYVEDESIVSDAHNWLPAQMKESDEAFESEGNVSGNLPKVNVLLVNRKQMMIILMTLSKLLSIAREDVNFYQVCQRLMIQGSAGTGKSQVIKIVSRLVMRMFKSKQAVLNCAPTGAASVLLPNGRTIHSTTNIPRITKESDSSVSRTDNPMNVAQMKKMKKIVADNQGHLRLMLVNTDEKGMIGQRILGWFNDRVVATCKALYPQDSHEFSVSDFFGCIPVWNLSGDLFQLQPVAGKDLFKSPNAGTTPIQQAGFAAYMSFDDVIILDEVMRQKPSQVDLLNCLNNIRLGQVTQADWQQINERALSNLGESDSVNFDDSNDSLIWLTETWAEAGEQNFKMLSALDAPIAVIPSTGRGYHQNNDRELGQIRKTCFLAQGSRQMLSKNHGRLTSFGLNNGAVGIVKCIYYDEGHSPPEFPKFVVVDFKNYSGPAWLPNHPTFIPMVLWEGARCEQNCCSRTGYPLILAYGITIAKAQGMTIGAGENITHTVIKLSDNIQMEKSNLGLAYTAFSRVCEFTDFAIAEKLPFERLAYVNRHPNMKMRLREEERLQLLAKKTESRNTCSVDQYLRLVEEIDLFCSDGITDSVCMKSSTECACCFHLL